MKYAREGILELLGKKEHWHYYGIWVQPPLFSCFWRFWARKQSFLEFGLPPIDGAIVYLNGHHVEPKEGVYSIQKTAAKAITNQDNSFFEKYVTVARKHCHVLVKYTESLDLTDKGLLGKLEKFKLLTENMFSTWLTVFPITYALDAEIKTGLERAGLKQIELVHHFEPRAPTRMIRQEREAKEFAKYMRDANLTHLLAEKPEKILGLLNKSHADLAKRISAHLKEFEWIGTHHWWGDPMDAEKLFTQIRDSPLAMAEIPNSPSVPEKLMWMIKWQAECAFWRQYCAETSDIAMFKVRPLIKVAGKQLGLKYEDVIWLTMEEIIEGLKGKTIPTKSAIAERKKGYCYIPADDGDLILSLEEGKQLIKLHTPSIDVNVRQFSGTIGSKGFAVGTAFVCHTPMEAIAMKKGEILVVPQTTPDYIVVMKKASAIVTDEGGITCHAAIVSRELGIPAVVGTKVSTQVLKTGDLIEVDANTGTVKKIS